MYRLLESTSGNAMLELAICLPLLVLLLEGLAAFGVAWYCDMQLMGALRAGAQYALVYPDNTGQIQAAVHAGSPLNVATADVSVARCSGESVLSGTLPSGVSCPPAAYPGQYLVIGAHYLLPDLWTYGILGVNRTIASHITFRVQ